MTRNGISGLYVNKPAKSVSASLAQCRQASGRDYMSIPGFILTNDHGIIYGLIISLNTSSQRASCVPHLHITQSVCLKTI